jgi:hypothetical protein
MTIVFAIYFEMRPTHHFCVMRTHTIDEQALLLPGSWKTRAAGEPLVSNSNVALAVLSNDHKSGNCDQYDMARCSMTTMRV